MATNVADILATVGVDTRRVKQGHKDIKKFDRTLEKSAKKGTRNLNTLNSSISRMTLGLGSLTIGLVAMNRAMTESVRKFAEFERQQLTTTALLETTSYASGLTTSEIAALTREIGFNTLASAEGARRAANQLLTFKSIAGDVFKETLKSAQDLATLGFGSIETAAVQLAKALEDPSINLSNLRRIGVTFSQDMIKQIKDLQSAGDLLGAQRLTLGAVQAQTAGAGEGAASRTAGLLDTLSEARAEFGIAVGAMVADSNLFRSSVRLMTDTMLAGAKLLEQWTGSIDTTAPKEVQLAQARENVTTARADLQSQLRSGLVEATSVLGSVPEIQKAVNERFVNMPTEELYKHMKFLATAVFHEMELTWANFREFGDTAMLAEILQRENDFGNNASIWHSWYNDLQSRGVSPGSTQPTMRMGGVMSRDLQLLLSQQIDEGKLDDLMEDLNKEISVLSDVMGLWGPPPKTNELPGAVGSTGFSEMIDERDTERRRAQLIPNIEYQMAGQDTLAEKAERDEEWRKEQLKREQEYLEEITEIFLAHQETKKRAREAELAEYKKYMDAMQIIGIQGWHQALGVIEMSLNDNIALMQSHISVFGDLLDTASEHSKQAFQLSKALAIAQATVNGLAAVVNSYKFGTEIGGPPLGTIFGAVAAGATGAMIGKIAATEFKSRKMGGPVVPGEAYLMGKGHGTEGLNIGGQTIVIPGEAGTVTPANRMGGDINVTVVNKTGVAAKGTARQVLEDDGSIGIIIDLAKKSYTNDLINGGNENEQALRGIYGLSRGGQG